MASIPKIDFKKELKDLYLPKPDAVVLVTVPAMKFLMIDGKGYPGDNPEYQDALEVLYGMSYTLKFTMKKKEVDPFDWTVPPLEGLWYADDPAVFRSGELDEWKWTMMIMQPDRISGEDVSRGIADLKGKKNPKAIEKLYFKTFDEGLCAQIMHVGPYSEEAPTIDKLHAYISDNGYTFNGEHHELYIGDPRRTAAEKLKTVIRHPIRKK